MEVFLQTVRQATHEFIRASKHQEMLARALWVLAEEDPQTARFLLYEWVIDYRSHPNIRSAIEQVAHRHVLWDHPSLRSIGERFREQDRFIESPPTIEEGVIECIRCRSKRTFSFSKQTRRGDESTTVFVRCSQCSKTFRI